MYSYIINLRRIQIDCRDDTISILSCALDGVIFHGFAIEARHRELSGKFINSLPQFLDLRVALQTFAEILKFWSTFLLNFQCDLQGFVQENGNLFKVGLNETTGGEGGGSNSNPSRSDGTGVSWHTVFVQCNTDGIASFFRICFQ